MTPVISHADSHRKLLFLNETILQCKVEKENH